MRSISKLFDRKENRGGSEKKIIKKKQKKNTRTTVSVFLLSIFCADEVLKPQVIFNTQNSYSYYLPTLLSKLPHRN